MTGSGGGKAPLDAGRDVVYDLGAASVFVLDHLLSQWFTWLTMPLEFLQAEDPRLGIHSTTVYFPMTSTGQQPTVAGAQLVPTGGAADLQVKGATVEDDFLVVDVELRVPTEAFAVCSFTLCDPDVPANSKSFVLPFGVPGGTV
jgi:hypothetical protein